MPSFVAKPNGLQRNSGGEIAADQGLDAQVRANRYVQQIDAFVPIESPLDAVKQRTDGERAARDVANDDFFLRHCRRNIKSQYAEQVAGKSFVMSIPHRRCIVGMCSRADPVDSAEILGRCWSGPLDPIIPRERKGFSSRMIIDACRPFEWCDKFAPRPRSAPSGSRR
jgi:hypothetical protein